MGCRFTIASKFKIPGTRTSGDAELIHILSFEVSLKLNTEPKNRVARMWVNIELCLFSVLGNWCNQCGVQLLQGLPVPTLIIIVSALYLFYFILFYWYFIFVSHRDMTKHAHLCCVNSLSLLSHIQIWSKSLLLIL